MSEITLQIQQKLKNYTNHPHIELSSRGNTAIHNVLYLLKKSMGDDIVDIKKKIILIPDQGGWITYQEYAEELDSPISGKDFMDFLRAKAAAFGRDAGFTFAEGFTVERTPGVTDLFSLK